MQLEQSSQTQNKDSVGKVTSFFLFRSLINGYNTAKDLPEEERTTIKKYGAISTILSLIALFISLGCLFSVLSNFQFIGFNYVVMMVIYFLGGVLVSLLLSVYAFVFATMQLRLNRKAIGIWGIVLAVLSTISSILLVVFIFA